MLCRRADMSRGRTADAVAVARRRTWCVDMTSAVNYKRLGRPRRQPPHRNPWSQRADRGSWWSPCFFQQHRPVEHDADGRSSRSLDL